MKKIENRVLHINIIGMKERKKTFLGKKNKEMAGQERGLNYHFPKKTYSVGVMPR